MMDTKEKKREIIEKHHVVFCEGEDEKWFLIWLLNSQELSDVPFYSNDIQVINFGGNEELSDKLNLLKITPGFQEVESLLVIRDAERDARRAVQKIQSSLGKAQLPVPSAPGEWTSGGRKVGFLLFPNCDQTIRDGTLEDLCLSILKEENHSIILDEVQLFLKSLEQNHKRQFPHIFKSKLHTYFSVTDDFVGLKIGEAARARAFDWNNDKLAFLKSFLLSSTD